MADKYILALDQGTTSSRAIIFDHSGQIVAQQNQEFEQIYPKPGWVEHNPEDIWSSQINVAHKGMQDRNLTAADFAAIGITNQRETTVVWDRHTGVPIHNAIVWQDRRTAGFCDDLKRRGWTDQIRDKTGLVIDAYFSGTKVKWLLTGGAVHVTDYSNASRTMLFNIHDLKWDEDILKEFNIPASMLPEAHPS